MVGTRHVYVNWGCPRAPGRYAPGAPMGVAPRARPAVLPLARLRRARTGSTAAPSHMQLGGCAAFAWELRGRGG